MNLARLNHLLFNWQKVFLTSLISLVFLVLAHPSKALESNVGAPAKDWTYTVKLNESYERIYQKYLANYSDIAKLAAYNKHPIDKKLQPNQVLNIPLSMLKKVHKPVEVILVTGNVSLLPYVKTPVVNKTKPAGKKTSSPQVVPQKQVLVIGQKMTTGDTITTGANSIAKIQFADGSLADIQPNATLKINASYQYAGQGGYVTQLKLTQGRTEIKANPQQLPNHQFQIETPSAVAAVRGTEFRVGAEGELALQETLGGTVAFSASGAQVLLAQGFGSAAEKDKAPLPPIVLPATPDVSGFAKEVDTIPVEFTLVPQADAVAWVSLLALDADFTKIVDEKTTTLNSASAEATLLSYADIPDGQYYLKLRAKEKNGLQGMDATHAFTLKARPLPPMLIAPGPEAAVGNVPFELSWKGVAGANSYIVQIALEASFTNVVFERITSFNQLQVQPAALNVTANKQAIIDSKAPLYWRVSSLAQGKPVRFSKIRRFTR